MSPVLRLIYLSSSRRKMKWVHIWLLIRYFLLIILGMRIPDGLLISAVWSKSWACYRNTYTWSPVKTHFLPLVCWRAISWYKMIRDIYKQTCNWSHISSATPNHHHRTRTHACMLMNWNKQKILHLYDASYYVLSKLHTPQLPVCSKYIPFCVACSIWSLFDAISLVYCSVGFEEVIPVELQWHWVIIIFFVLMKNTIMLIQLLVMQIPLNCFP